LERTDDKRRQVGMTQNMFFSLWLLVWAFGVSNEMKHTSSETGRSVLSVVRGLAYFMSLFLFFKILWT